MKRNENFILREVAGTQLLVPVGEATLTFPGMVTVNTTSAFLWEKLEEPQTAQTLAEYLLQRYAVSEAQAMEDVEKFLHTLMEIGAIIE